MKAFHCSPEKSLITYIVSVFMLCSVFFCILRPSVPVVFFFADAMVVPTLFCGAGCEDGLIQIQAIPEYYPALDS